MSQFTFNSAKGRAIQQADDNANKIGILLLKTCESDANMKKRTTLTELLAHNTECDFTNYARKTGLTEVLTLDQATGKSYLGVAGQTFVAAGGGTDNAILKLITFIRIGADDDDHKFPITAHDFVVTTTGLDIPATMPANGFYYDA